jgi:hypothetical protein
MKAERDIGDQIRGPPEGVANPRGRRSGHT